MIGASIGIKIQSGPEGDLGGVVGGTRSKVYYHNVKLVVGADIIDIKAGFSWDLTENLLGRSASLTISSSRLIPPLSRPASIFKESNDTNQREAISSLGKTCFALEKPYGVTHSRQVKKVDAMGRIFKLTSRRVAH